MLPAHFGLPVSAWPVARRPGPGRFAATRNAQAEHVLHAALESSRQRQGGRRRRDQAAGLDRADPRARKPRSPCQLLLRPAAQRATIPEVVSEIAVTFAMIVSGYATLVSGSSERYKWSSLTRS